MFFIVLFLVLRQGEYAINVARIVMSAQDQQSMTVKHAQICISSWLIPRILIIVENVQIIVKHAQAKYPAQNAQTIISLAKKSVWINAHLKHLEIIKVHVKNALLDARDVYRLQNAQIVQSELGIPPQTNVKLLKIKFILSKLIKSIWNIFLLNLSFFSSLSKGSKHLNWLPVILILLIFLWKLTYYSY